MRGQQQQQQQLQQTNLVSIIIVLELQIRVSVSQFPDVNLLLLELEHLALFLLQLDFAALWAQRRIVDESRPSPWARELGDRTLQRVVDLDALLEDEEYYRNQHVTKTRRPITPKLALPKYLLTPHRMLR